MKQKKIVFNKPVKVFQIFRHTNFYTKREKSLNDRKEFLKWEEQVSLAGYVQHNSLFLNEKIIDDPDFLSCNLITINHVKEQNIKFEQKLYLNNKSEIYNEYNSCLYLLNSVKLEGVLELRNENKLELYVLPNDSHVMPRRNYFKLCDVEINQPVEIKLNEKYDFAWSQKQRTFIEERYIIEYHGVFEECNILTHPFEPVVKTIPTKTKMINLTKPLW